MRRERPPESLDPRVQREEARWNWQMAMTAAVLLAAGQAGYALLEVPIVGVHPMVDLRMAHVLLNMVVVGLLWQRRDRPTTPFVVAAYFVVALPLLPIMWIAEVKRAAAGLPWTPFTGFKFVLLPAALMTPGPLYLALGLTAAIGIEAVIEYFVMDFAANPMAAPGEPAQTVVFTLVACGTIYYRLRTHRTELAAARVRAEAAAFQRLATLFLALRDGTGTPLQTLEIGTALLRDGMGDCTATVARMQRAIEQLRDIQRSVAHCEELVQKTSNVASFDARATLASLEEDYRQFAESQPHPPQHG